MKYWLRTHERRTVILHVWVVLLKKGPVHIPSVDKGLRGAACGCFVYQILGSEELLDCLVGYFKHLQACPTGPSSHLERLKYQSLRP